MKCFQIKFIQYLTKLSLFGYLTLFCSWCFLNEQVLAEDRIPTLTYIQGQQKFQVPDWSQIAWGNLPAIQEAGKIKVASDLVKKIGYDPSRSWKAGDRLSQIVKLGDIKDAFHLEAFALEDISSLTGLAMKNLNLEDLGLMRWQNLSSLVKAIPDLGKLPVDRVAPIRDLLKGEWGDRSIAEVLSQNPALGSIPLNQLDLKRYNLQSIPGLTQVPIGKFANWQQSFINQVPGLNRVPFNKFPTPLANGTGVIGTVDIVWSGVERGDPNVGKERFISGTVNKKNATVPIGCQAGKRCAYIELSDPTDINGSLQGMRWASGSTQEVNGGFGLLGKVNGGREPAGRLVYGSAFKVVATKIDESKGTVNFSLYLRACARIAFYGKSCTPYFIPIPWLPAKEKGIVTIAAIGSPTVKIPAKYQQRIAQLEAQYEPQSNAPASSNTPVVDAIGETNTKVVEAINRGGSFSSNVPGTDGGRNGCMWAVNNVLKDAGYAPLANDTLSVRAGQTALENGRGQRIDIADARPGDIVLVDNGGSHQHIGFCTNQGCTETISNSSSNANFSFRGNSNFSYPGSPYNGSVPQVYRLKN